MIIRATAKLLNISRIKPVKNLADFSGTMPGEWYASIVSLPYAGKFAIHFLHTPTFITILVPGKSLNNVVPNIPDKLSSLLKRNGFLQLREIFILDPKPEIFATNSRSMLGHMNQIKYNLEYHLALPETLELTNYEAIEDIHLRYMFGIPKKREYLKPIEILKDLSKNLLNQ